MVQSTRPQAECAGANATTVRISMKTSRLKNGGYIQNSLILAAFGFGLVLTASGQDFDTDWFFPKPLTQTTRFGISPFYGYRFGGEIQDPNTDTKYSFKDGPAYIRSSAKEIRI